MITNDCSAVPEISEGGELAFGHHPGHSLTGEDATPAVGRRAREKTFSSSQVAQFKCGFGRGCGSSSHCSMTKTRTAEERLRVLHLPRQTATKDSISAPTSPSDWAVDIVPHFQHWGFPKNGDGG